MKITDQLLQVNLRLAREAHAELLAKLNAKAGEVQTLERLLAISAQPESQPTPPPTAPASTTS